MNTNQQQEITSCDSQLTLEWVLIADCIFKTAIVRTKVNQFMITTNDRIREGMFIRLGNHCLVLEQLTWAWLQYSKLPLLRGVLITIEIFRLITINKCAEEPILYTVKTRARDQNLRNLYLWRTDSSKYFRHIFLHPDSGRMRWAVSTAAGSRCYLSGTSLTLPSTFVFLSHSGSLATFCPTESPRQSKLSCIDRYQYKTILFIC